MGWFHAYYCVLWFGISLFGLCWVWLLGGLVGWLLCGFPGFGVSRCSAGCFGLVFVVLGLVLLVVLLDLWVGVAVCCMLWWWVVLICSGCWYLLRVSSGLRLYFLVVLAVCVWVVLWV